ncbi:MAG: haloalkane dehalogenase [Acidimicrobiales bacterium]|nr:haloalkane dehalogenase [Acidimicrobiales bacterium]MCB9371525.1 haloalkane dehalogenase [Microthrixaceae bacterium]
MEVLRTPDERFAGLPDWDFAPHYRTVTAADGTELRFHFVDEGPRDAAPILLLHGNPSWSYLHRHMVRGLADLGHRVLALDLMGMGRSDKPAARSDYTLAGHVDWMGQWLEAEDLTGVTLYCQDWGGLTGLQLLPDHGDRFDRVLASNTGIPVGEGVNRFMQQWLDFSQSVSELPIGSLVAGGTSRDLSPEEQAAYDAPFPDGTYQASPLQFPLLIPLQPDNPGVPQSKATWAYLATWEKPFLTVFGSEDAIAYQAGAHRRFQDVVPGAQGQPHEVIAGADHFIQEDASPRLVEILHSFAGG